MPAEAVVFDIGNVLIEWNPERFFDHVIGPERRKALFADVDLAEMNDRVDMGAHFTDTVYAKADAHPEWQCEIRLWHDRWLEMAAPAIERSVRLMTALQNKGIPVFSLTNFGVQSYVLAARSYEFLNRFDRDFISGHLRVMKPDDEIYAILESETGVAPEALLFTDDREDNIRTARRRGWRTHHFQGPDGWADRLVHEGLLTKDEAA